MSEYELSLLRQRGLAARDAKAQRGELRFGLPPGFCWDDLGRLVKDPDVRVADAVALVFEKFAALGSVRQVRHWFLDAGLCLPRMHPGPRGAHVVWRTPADHNVLGILRSPLYAGAYVFGRTENRTHVVEGRACTTAGHPRTPAQWPVLLRDHHAAYLSWAQVERNAAQLAENAHMQTRAARKAGRGGRALLTGLLRCGRCGRMLHVVYGSAAGHAHRYHGVGDDMHGAGGRCLGIGGVRVDRAVSAQLLAAVAPHAVQAALDAADRAADADADVRRALTREVEEARYEAQLAARRYEAVDPARCLVAAELEVRWEAALARVGATEQRLAARDSPRTGTPPLDRSALIAVAADLPRVWNAPETDLRTKQRLVHLLVREIVVSLDDTTNEAVAVIHWMGGRHSECRIRRVRTGRYPEGRAPPAAEAVRRLGGQFPDRELAVSLNRMRCRTATGQTWTTSRVRQLREELGVAAFDPAAPREPTVSMDAAAHRLNISIGSVQRLVRSGVLPATQLLPAAPWQIPVAALESPAVRDAVAKVVRRRPRNAAAQEIKRSLTLLTSR